MQLTDAASVSVPLPEMYSNTTWNQAEAEALQLLSQLSREFRQFSCPLAQLQVQAFYRKRKVSIYPQKVL